MAWDDLFLKAWQTRNRTNTSSTYNSVGVTNILTNTRTEDGGFTSAGTTRYSISQSWLGSASGVVLSASSATDGTTSANGITGNYESSAGTFSSGQTVTGNASWITTTTDTDGSTGTAPTSSSFSSTESSSGSILSTLTLSHCTGTSSGTTTYTGAVSTTGTISVTVPTTTGSPVSTTTTTTSCNATMATTATRTSTFMDGAFATITVSDGVEPDKYAFTYYVPKGSVAWVLTLDATNEGLIDLADQANSYTESFTYPDSTTLHALGGIVFGTDTPSETVFGIRLNSDTVSALGQGITTQSTTVSFFGIDQVPNGFSTSTGTGTATTTVSNIFTIDPGTDFDTGAVFHFVGTETTMVSLSQRTTSTQYIATLDDQGRPTGFVIGTGQTTVWNTYESTVGAGAGTFTFSQSDTRGGLTQSTVGQGATVIVPLTEFGFVGAATGGLGALDPNQQRGVCVPTGKITDRRGYEHVSVAGGSFPAPYCLGAQTGISGPLLGNYITLTDGTATWTLSYNGASVSATKEFLVGGSHSQVSQTGVLTEVGFINDPFWSYASLYPWMAYGGHTPDARHQIVSIGPAIMDVTTIDTASSDGVVTHQDADTFNATVGTGLAVAYLPALNVQYGPDPQKAVLFPAHS